MASFKSFALCLLLFCLASTLGLPTRTSAAQPDGECPTDAEEAEEHRSQNRPIDVREISARIWNGRKRLYLQYNNDPRVNRLFQTGYAAKTFSDLFQYYNRYTGQPDPCHGSRSSDCQKAQILFIARICHEIGGLGPIGALYHWLAQNGNFSGNYEDFANELYRIWFTPYSRSNGRYLDSSGFEHVFLGEITQNPRRRPCVSGFHNWMRMWDEETKRNFALTATPNYGTSKHIVASVQFQWHDSRPKRSSFFTETNPAVEIALYTLCFMTQPGRRCQVVLDNTPLYLQTYAMRNTAGLIGSAYPEY